MKSLILVLLILLSSILPVTHAVVDPGPTPVVDVPTLGIWGLIALNALLAVIGVYFLKKKK